MNVFIKGLIIGFSIAAPVGPIGLLCINRTLNYGVAAGFITGVGAALADAIYGCIAGFGLIAISEFLFKQQKLIQYAGAGFLFYLALKLFFAKPVGTRESETDKARTLWQDGISSLLLTLTNPATILSFIAIYSSLGIIASNPHYQQALAMVSGVFIGSLSWWGILCISIHFMRTSLSARSLKAINFLSGLILLLFASVTLLK